MVVLKLVAFPARGDEGAQIRPLRARSSKGFCPLFCPQATAEAAWTSCRYVQKLSEKLYPLIIKFLISGLLEQRLYLERKNVVDFLSIEASPVIISDSITHQRSVHLSVNGRKLNSPRPWPNTIAVFRFLFFITIVVFYAIFFKQRFKVCFRIIPPFFLWSPNTTLVQYTLYFRLVN